jgi:hypothetical protein
VACTHGLFADGALDKPAARDVTEIVCTNSVPLPADHPKLHVLSVAPALAAATDRNGLMEKRSACRACAACRRILPVGQAAQKDQLWCSQPCAVRCCPGMFSPRYFAFGLGGFAAGAAFLTVRGEASFFTASFFAGAFLAAGGTASASAVRSTTESSPPKSLGW